MTRIYRLAWLVSLVVSPGLAATYVVKTPADLAAAVSASARDDVVIVVSGTVTVTPAIVFPTTQGSLTITGEKTTSTIQFKGGEFDGDWTKPLPPANGLELYAASTTLYGLTIKGFNAPGSAVKYHGGGVLVIDRVTFSDCGTLYREPRVSPPASADDAFYNQVVGSHRSAAAIVITNCTFRRCATSQWDWSHCIYASGGYVGVIDNVFESCGNPFSIGNNDTSRPVIIAGNKLSTPATSVDRNGVARPAYLSSIPLGDAFQFTRNTVSGGWSYPLAGHARAARHLIDRNDYSAMTYAGHWAADTGKGETYTFEEWQKMGFDRASLGPR